MKDKIQKLREQFQDELGTVNASSSLEELRRNFLSKKGYVSGLMKELGKVPPEQKKTTGQLINTFKQEVIAKFEEKEKELIRLEEERAINQAESYDESLPTENPCGSYHPITLIQRELEDIFESMGFNVEDYSEIVDDYHCFEALNIPKYHPARDMQDTFFIEAHPDVVLRTHTSSVQTRVMETSKPPIRIICPGRVYRNEAISYRAHCFFHQVEALYVDKNVSFTDLKQVLLLFAKEMFGADTKIRLRPSYFPFTEPSAEMDISCNICGGKGCPFCKHTGWVEILGCGMVDPNVLESNGIDSKVYSGYALGMGIERITNLKYQVKDLRMFSENDTRFLKEFEAAY